MPDEMTPLEAAAADLRDILRRVQSDLVYEATTLDEGDTRYLTEPAVRMVRMSVLLDDALWMLERLKSAAVIQSKQSGRQCPCCGRHHTDSLCAGCRRHCGEGIHIERDYAPDPECAYGCVNCTCGMCPDPQGDRDIPCSFPECGCMGWCHRGHPTPVAMQNPGEPSADSAPPDTPEPDRSCSFPECGCEYNCYFQQLTTGTPLSMTPGHVRVFLDEYRAGKYNDAAAIAYSLSSTMPIAARPICFCLVCKRNHQHINQPAGGAD